MPILDQLAWINHLNNAHSTGKGKYRLNKTWALLMTNEKFTCLEIVHWMLQKLCSKYQLSKIEMYLDILQMHALILPNGSTSITKTETNEIV